MAESEKTKKPPPTLKEGAKAAAPGCAILIVFAALLFGIGYCIMRDPTPEEIAALEAERATERIEQEAVAKAKQKKELAVYALMICELLYESAAQYDIEIGFFDKDVSDFGPNKKRVIIDGKMQNGFGAWQPTTGFCDVFEDGDVIDFALKSNNRGDPIRPYTDAELEGISTAFRRQWNANN